MQITLSFSHYSFGIAFTSVWNILSPDSHMACSFTSLRSLPKNNLLREAFRPLSKKRQHHPRLSTLSSHFSLRYLFVSLFITSPPLEIKLTEGRNFILCLAHSNHSENISWMKDRKESRWSNWCLQYPGSTYLCSPVILTQSSCCQGNLVPDIRRSLQETKQLLTNNSLSHTGYLLGMEKKLFTP